MKSGTPRARELRRSPPKPERRLWNALRNRQIAGAKFRRQHKIDRFFADFACAEAKLVVELDGASHNERQTYDGDRTAILEACGWQVVRFTNTAVIEQLTATVEAIEAALRLARNRPLP